MKRPNPVLLGLGVVGWAGLIWLGVTMFTATPRTAGFDLELVLQAGRDLAAGASPYDPSMVAGAAPGATDLFYSYPPPVAQVASLFAGVPSAVMFVGLWVASVAGLAVAAFLIARRFAPDRPAGPVAGAALAVAPLVLPYSVGLLFGNLDVLFPFAYGLVLLAAVAGGTARSTAVGGASMALAAAAKIYPGLLGGWFVGRAAGARRGPDGRNALTALGVAIATGIAVLALSLAFGGVALWRDYIAVAGSASEARLLDPRNVGPAAQIALAVGGDEALVRTLQIPIALAAVVATLAAGAAVRDRLLGVSIAAVASLVLLPITWFHYPSALMPFAIAAVARAPEGRPASRTRLLVTAAVVVAALAIAWLPGVWIAVALVAAAVASSSPTDRSEART